MFELECLDSFHHSDKCFYVLFNQCFTVYMKIEIHQSKLILTWPKLRTLNCVLFLHNIPMFYGEVLNFHYTRFCSCWEVFGAIFYFPCLAVDRQLHMRSKRCKYILCLFSVTFFGSMKFRCFWSNCKGKDHFWVIQMDSQTMDITQVVDIFMPPEWNLGASSFWCRLQSIATHRDHFVSRPSVLPSVCHTSHFPKLCFAGDTCILRNAATIFILSVTLWQKTLILAINFEP